MVSSFGLRRALFGGCSVFVLCLGAPAIAQTAATTSAQTAAANNQLEEVVVTAQKRSENVQAVPISVTAIPKATLQNIGAVRSDQLALAVPGLQIQHEIDAVTTFIRGVGPNSNGTGEESSVAVYLDDLYIEQGDAAIFSLNAISDIQVLKGPQGTLFGRNATGGVIQVRTQDPSFDRSFDAHFGYGNYDTKSGDVYVTGGIIPNILAANIAFTINNEAEGWGRDVVTGERAFTSNEWAVRAKFLLTPTDSTRILLALNHFYTRGEQGLGFNQVPQYIAAGAPGLITGAKFAGWYNTEDFKNDVSVIKHDMIELRVEQETEIVKLVDIMGWQRMNGYAQFAQDASPLALVDTRLNQKGRDWSNEFQVLNSPDAPYASWLTWIAGAFYLHDDSGYGNAILRGAAFGFPVQTTPPGFSLLLNDNVDTTSVAGFAQATVELLPKLKLTGGVRYTRDDRTFTGGLYLSPALGGGPAGVPTTESSPGASKGWSMNTYRASLDYHFTDDLMAYFSFNRGTKSGQFDTFGTAATGPIITPPVNPEVLYAYEVGMKSEWLDHRVRLNLAAFHYDISNLQFAVIVPGGTKLVNAAGAEIDGGEVDATARVIENLTLSTALSIQQGHYTSFPGAPAYFSPGGVIDAAGNPTVHTPDFTGTFSADYAIPSEIGDFNLNANFTHTSSFEFFPDKSLQQPETNIFNASVMWTSPDERYDVRLWGANITGEKYYVFGSESRGLGKQFSPAAPATFGVTFGVHFSGTSEEAPAPAAYVPPPVQAAAPAPKSYLVFFDFNKSDLTSQAIQIVDQAASNAGPAHVTQLTVTGHTDTVGSDAYNMRLSRRRAESVAARLEKDGIPASEIQIVAKGKRDLLVPTADGVREPQNRRVQIVYDGGPTS